MELVKPEPLIISGRPHYTLSSTDPVSIEIEVPYTTDQDVDYALQIMVLQAGGTLDKCTDDAWIASNFEGATAAELRAAVAAQVRQMNAELAEQQKATQAAHALAQRLQQRIPASHIASSRQLVIQTFRAGLAQQGLSEADFLLQAGMRRNELEVMFDEQAYAAAENEAALDAFVAQRKVEVADEELPRLLGLRPADAEHFLSEAAAAGQLDDVKRAARRSKALEIVLAECRCTYRHETPDEARRRVADLEAEQQLIISELDRANGAKSAAEQHPHLKLV